MKFVVDLPAVSSVLHQLPVPPIITREDDRTARRFLEFFTATIRNKNTRSAYAQAVSQFFSWADERGFTLQSIEPMMIAAYTKITKECMLI